MNSHVFPTKKVLNIVDYEAYFYNARIKKKKVKK